MSTKSKIEKILMSEDYNSFLKLAEHINMSELNLLDNSSIMDKRDELKKKQYYENSKIRFTYAKDEYGEYARELHEKIGIPKYAYPGDAGFDLPIVLSKEDIQNSKQLIWPHERGILHTGMIFEFPVGYHGRIVHRSSCEKNYRLRVIEGIIDDYRGEVLIQVANQNSCQIEVKHGNKLAQMIILPNAGFEICHSDELRPSKRSNKGFGSSGK